MMSSFGGQYLSSKDMKITYYQKNRCKLSKFMVVSIFNSLNLRISNLEVFLVNLLSCHTIVQTILSYLRYVGSLFLCLSPLKVQRSQPLSYFPLKLVITDVQTTNKPCQHNLHCHIYASNHIFLENNLTIQDFLGIILGMNLH